MLDNIFIAVIFKKKWHLKAFLFIKKKYTKTDKDTFRTFSSASSSTSGSSTAARTAISASAIIAALTTPAIKAERK